MGDPRGSATPAQRELAGLRLVAARAPAGVGGAVAGLHFGGGDHRGQQRMHVLLLVGLRSPSKLRLSRVPYIGRPRRPRPPGALVRLRVGLSPDPPIPAAPRRRTGLASLATASLDGPWPIGRDPKGSPCRCPADRPWTGPATPRHPRIIGGSGLSASLVSVEVYAG